MEPPLTDTRVPLIIGVTSAAIGLIGISMAIRIYIRGYLMHAWKLDDTMFICSAVLAVSQITLIMCGTIYGALGQHIWMVTPPLIKKDAHFMVAGSLMYQVAFPLVKATYLAQYRRAFALPNLELLCNVFLGILFVIACALLILGGVVMRGFTDPDPNKFPDIESTGFAVFNYFTGATNLATGIIIFILPIALVGRMRLAPMQKAGLIACFGVGICTCAMSVMRIINMRFGLGSSDPYYGIVPLTLLGAAELTSAVVCVSVPLMRPLLSCAGTTGYRSKGFCEPSSAASGEAASRIRWKNGLPLHSTPTYSTTPQTARVSGSGGSINGDISGFHTSQQVRESIESRFATDISTPTKARADHEGV